MSGYQLKQNDKACFEVARGSSIIVATLMCLPDAIALIPAVPDFLHWLVRVIGLWLSASILWTLGLFVVLKIAFAVSGPLLIENAGIRLTRFSKLIHWNWIGALSVEDHENIRRAFLMPIPVMRLLLYLPKYEEKGKWVKGRAHIVPSLWFSKEQFESLIAFAGKKCFGVTVSGLPVLLGLSPLREETRDINKQKKVFRYLYSALVTIGIVTVLGRNAIVNYSYNAGNRAVRAERLDEAIGYYRTALQYKPAFAIGWHQLATLYWLKGEEKEAEDAWRHALMMRPDLVEAKVGLAYLYIKRNQCEEAKTYLEKALRLSPTYVPGYIALAEVYLKTNDVASAKASLVMALKMDKNNVRAKALLAQIEHQVSGDNK